MGYRTIYDLAKHPNVMGNPVQEYETWKRSVSGYKLNNMQVFRVLCFRRKKGKFVGFDRFIIWPNGDVAYMLSPTNHEKLENGNLKLYMHPDKEQTQFKEFDWDSWVAEQI